MNQLIYSPYSRLNNLQRGFGRAIDRRSEDGATLASESSDWVPHIDIQEIGDSFKVQADIPGVDPKDIDVTLDKNVLTIRGSRSGANARNNPQFCPSQ